MYCICIYIRYTIRVSVMKLDLCISMEVARKLHEKHGVTRDEIEECFYNRAKGLLEDTREQHQTVPPTLWFIAETDTGRRLKIVFVELEYARYEIKTAYAPNNEEGRIY